MDERFDDFTETEPRPTYDNVIPAAPDFSEPMGSPNKKKKQKGTGVKTGVIALCCALAGSTVGSALTIGAYQSKLQAEAKAQLNAEVSYILESRRQTSDVEVLTIDGSTEMTAAQVYAANVGSTVGITTSITTNYWGFQTTSAASGSGFILTADGYILTNYHVIEDSDSISVSLHDGTVYEAQLIGYDESNDIAVLKVEADNLVPVVLGDSDGLSVGDNVVAIGNPLGELTFSLTAGLISAKDREVTLSSSVTMDLIQTDCAINSGNSGGALFNLYGEVIGITNAKYSSSSSEASIDNIGFAIPINDVIGIVESIIEKGYISKPYIGVSVSNVSSEAQAYGIPEGAAVQSVTAGSPAEEGGLQTGDVITMVNGTAITCSSDLVDYVGSCGIGDTLNLTIYRQGQTLELTVTIGENIQSALANEEAAQEQTQQQQQQGQVLIPGFGFGSGRR